jgi:hypothetical protein
MEMETVGAVLGTVEYEPTGGRCPTAGCKADAPLVRVGSRVIAVLCATHEAELTNAADRSWGRWPIPHIAGES